MTEKHMTEASTTNEAEPQIPAAIGAASLSPKRRRMGLVLAFVGLFGFAGALAVTVSSESLRLYAAPFVPAFFFAWKVGKTILRGNIDKL